jgi:D-apionolactonase
MGSRTDLRLLHGTDDPLQELRLLRAGPMTAALDGVDLRYLTIGDRELVRRIYVAVRDKNWNTIPGTVAELEVDQQTDSFNVRMMVRHSSQETDFTWEGRIIGAADGRITFTMDGRARRHMLYNRIGFCVLHPWRETAGQPFFGQTPDGPIDGTLPRLVGPQRFENGVYVPLFPSISRLTVQLAGGTMAICEFTGDLFETEDQRNWGDASFKTYCTPLALGFPHELKEGQALSQSVTVYTEGNAEAAGTAASRVAIGSPTGARMPAIGLGSAATAPSRAETDLLRALAPAHLRADIHLADPRWGEVLEGALALCDSLGAALELALFTRPDQGDDLERLGEALADADVARVLVALEDARTATPDETTSPELVELVRDRLRLDDVPVAGGTDMYFCELNRTWPQTAAMDGVFWSVNAQVHAFDDVSVLETPEALGEQVRAAHALASEKPLFVGPVALARRYNVNATDDSDDDAARASDPRQRALIGAAWTAATVKHLAEQGASSVTYFETTGPRGVVADGAPLPLFHALADAAGLKGGEVLACETTRPLDVAALAVRYDGGITLLVANLLPRRQTVAVEGLPDRVSARRVNAATGGVRSDATPLPSNDQLDLEPYELARIDAYTKETRRE